jgi:hypothetical membrane protein
METITAYGWHFLLAAIIGEMAVPFILAPFYKGYSHTKMAISSLGSTASPVRLPFNTWMLIAGVLFLLSTPALYDRYNAVSKPLSITAVAFGLALIFFVLFVMADKPEFQGRWVAKEGLWQRLNLLFMYLPLAIIAVNGVK